MVRVIPVHNFSGQSVASIEEPTASCTAVNNDREMLLLALSSHCVEVHELGEQPRVIAIFPTVDTVREMLHCDRENYVATLESKRTRDGAAVNNFVRIYVNWALGGNQNQAMRARIAGRVTPSSNRTSNGLEMIELPLGVRPTGIACCQTTGNLLVASDDTAILHRLRVERQAHSKRKFIDFEAKAWSLGFSFSPISLQITEDFILISDRRNFVAFRLIARRYEDSDQASSADSSAVQRTTNSGEKNSRGDGARNGSPGLERIRGNKEARLDSPSSDNDRSSETNRSGSSSWTWDSSVPIYDITNTSSYVDWDRFESLERRERARGKNEVKLRRIELPALKSNAGRPGGIGNPLVARTDDLDVAVKASSPVDGWSESYAVRRLACFKISDEGVTSCSEYFACSLLKPVYLRNENSRCSGKTHTLRSERYKNLDGVSCVLCTAQEGYLFYFSNSDEEGCKNFHALRAIYPFTAPVKRVVLEDTVLHALTDAGLETYTLRLSYSANSIDENSKLGDAEPVSLIGLRPFMGVQRLLRARNYVILLTQADNHWTLYALSLPSAVELYNDVLAAATSHRATSPGTYRHLLREAHTIVTLAKDIEPTQAKTIDSENKEGDETLHELYKESCSLLAEYYINSETPDEWKICVPYFAMAGTRIAEVLSRKGLSQAPGIGTYLTETLPRLKSGPEADALFQVFNVVEIIASTEKKNLLKLILGSPVLREYATEKLTSILLSLDQDDMTKFALVLLYVQADRQEQAERTIKPIADNCVTTMCLKHWNCLFDVTRERNNGQTFATFSDLSVVLMRQKSAIFADVLVKIVDSRAVTLHQILQIFLAHLPSRVGRDGHVAASVLQSFVETYLRRYFEFGEKSRDKTRYDYSIVEAFKILVRSYLGKLTQTNVYEIDDNRNENGVDVDEEDYLFRRCRPVYLDRIIGDGEVDKGATGKSKMRARREILKLQALLASDYLPDECLQEVQDFLKAHTVDGDFTFRLLRVSNHDGTHMLLDNCPRALLQYAKERYSKESEWKYLVRLLYEKISGEENSPDACSAHEQALEDTLIHLARTMSLKGLQHLLSSESTSILQRYGDICSKIMHADHVNSMIIGTGQHLLFNINV